MGPATAVLLIPRLGWVDVKTKTAVQIFVGADLENRPHGDMTLEGCDALALDVGNFSCTQGAYSTGFEQLVETAIQSGLTDSVDLDNYLYYDSALYQDYGLIQEGPLKALANYSMTGPAALFVPHRQVLRNLSEDIREQLEGAEIDDGIGEKAPRTQRALDLLVQREGPSFGFDWVCGISNVTLIDISAERTVACFSNWTYNDTSRVYNKVSSTDLLIRSILDTRLTDILVLWYGRLQCKPKSLILLSGKPDWKPINGQCLSL